MIPTIIHTGLLSVNTLIVPLVDNKVFIVDPASCSYSQDENVIINYLNDNNLVPIAVILTHGHFDHISGLPILRKNFPSIPILINEKDSKMIGENSEVEQSSSLMRMGLYNFIPYVSNLPSATSFLVDEKSVFDCLSNDDMKKISDDVVKNSLTEWKVIHTPGHTPGCVCIFNQKEKILISGDTLFYHSRGRTDLPGGSEFEIQKSISSILEIIDDDVKIYPGHDRTGFTKID